MESAFVDDGRNPPLKIVLNRSPNLQRFSSVTLICQSLTICEQRFHTLLSVF